MFWRALPRPGKCLAVAATPPSCRAAAKGIAVRGDRRGARAEAAFGLLGVAARPGDVEHRRQIDVDADVAQVGGGAGALGAGEAGAAGAHLRRRGGRGAVDPLHQAALLVDHHQQRVAQPGGTADRLQGGDRAAARLAAREVLGEEDDARDAALADHRPDRRGRLGAGEADHQPLARELLRGSACEAALGSGGVPSPSATPKAKAPAASPQRRGDRRPPSAFDRELHPDRSLACGRMGPLISFDEALALGELSDHEEIGELVERAWEVRQENFGDSTDMCSLVNAKSGGCAEDCGFCAQSRYAEADTPMHAMMEPEQILEHAKAAEAAGAHRFCMVTQGQGLSKRDFAKILEGAELVAEQTNLKRCASIGHMSTERAQALREAGIQRVHHNVESARSYYPEVSSHGPLRGPAADDPGGQGGGARDLRRRHPQPRRDAAPAGRDGLRALRAQPDLGADQPAQPARGDEVRRAPADGRDARSSSGWRSSA